jgi:hypothetical protein
MSAQKLVKVNGSYRNTPVPGVVFPLVKALTKGKKGDFVTVDGTTVSGYPDRHLRIKVASKSDYEFVKSDTPMGLPENAPKTVETDEEAIARIRDRFAILNEMTEATIEGTVRGMIVSGPPGVGKSYGVEHTLERSNTFTKLAGKKCKYEIVRGAMTALGLYALLFKWSDPGKVLVLDDCDTVLWDELSLNLLKGALDSSKHRRLFWNADSHKLRGEGIPDQYEFNGSIIFISNLKFDQITKSGRVGKIKDHLEAIISRCHYLDLTLDTMRDRMLRIHQIVGDGMLDDYKFSSDETKMIVDYIDEHKDKLREVSLRMVLKISDLYKMAPKNDHWKRLAETTCMHREVLV